MLFKKKKFPKLTSREIDILNILWENEKPLIASEIADARSDLTINTVQAVLRKLLKYQLVEVADIVYSGTVLSRSYRPTITSEDIPFFSAPFFGSFLALFCSRSFFPALKNASCTNNLEIK